jgi:hypothetical protein
MKKWVVLILLALAGVLTWFLLVTRSKPKEEVPKDQPVAVSRYSAGFNQSIDSLLKTYYALTEAFVNWDSSAVTAQATTLNKTLEHVKWDELQGDTVIYQTATSYIDIFKNAIPTMANAGDLTMKRQSFNTLSQNLYDLLRTIKYDGAKIYLQQCPMAFNDTEEGLWLSKSEKIRNPYLGLHHPKYKSGMISCGETKDTINFRSVK